MMRKRLLWHWFVTSIGRVTVCLGLLVAVQRLSAQEPAVTAATRVAVPHYDVVSIKPDRSDSGRVSISINDGNLDALNVPLRIMILGAYNLKDAQLIGLPKWADSAHFDIKAKILNPDKQQLESLSPEQFQSMQQPILTDRFQLKFHREKKLLPVYELVVLKGGPKFNEITAIEQKSEAGVNGVRAGGMNIHNHSLVATGVPMASLVNQLSAQLQRIVIDKTGLTAKYNFQLDWTPDDAGPPSADVTAPPDIFTALQEQLGLKLQPGKAEIDTFVVDHVESPSEN